MVQPVKLGIAGGLVWGTGIATCTILAMWTGYSKEWLSLMSSIYVGYSISWTGVLVGFVYGFFDAFISLSLIGWIYNKLKS